MISPKFQDVPQEHRVQVLIDNSDERTEETYPKDLTREQIDQRTEKVADNFIKLYGLEEDLKEIKTTFKAQMDPLRIESKGLLEEIKTRRTEVEGMLFHFIEDGMMNTYDKDGEFIRSRRLTEKEKAKQAKLFVAHGPTGTDD